MPPSDEAESELRSSIADLGDEMSNVQGQLEAIDEHICEVRDAIKDLPWSFLWMVIGAAFGAWLVMTVIDWLPTLLGWLVALYSSAHGR